MTRNKDVSENTINNSINTTLSANFDYICLFSAKSEVWYGQLLARDCKHCLVIIKRRNGWVYLDPLQTALVRKNIGNTDPESLLEAYSQLGYQLIYGVRGPTVKINKIGKATCVDFCKYFLGIDNSYIVTPKQLYNHLNNSKHGEVFSK